MEKPETLTIDDVLYIRADKERKCEGDVKIIILQRGNVVVGRLSVDKDNKDMMVLGNASVIRRWGTTHGIGQIALGGPTSSTVLDKAGNMRFHVLTSILIIDCEVSKWESYL